MQPLISPRLTSSHLISPRRPHSPRGACFKCEIELRRALRCPYSQRCRRRQDKAAAAAAAAAAATQCQEGGEEDGGEGEREKKGRAIIPTPTAWGSFCPHSLRCFVCDAFSCRRCALTRGDGEDVAALAEEFGASLRVLFLDFDRTLCSTRGGANPLGSGGGKGKGEGKGVEGGGEQGGERGSRKGGSKAKGKRAAAADTSLLALASSRRFKTVIVTRNPHSREIKEYLDGLGAADVTVRAVADEPEPRRATKASIIEDELGKLGVDVVSLEGLKRCLTVACQN